MVRSASTGRKHPGWEESSEGYRPPGDEASERRSPCFLIPVISTFSIVYCVRAGDDKGAAFAVGATGPSEYPSTRKSWGAMSEGRTTLSLEEMSALWDSVPYEVVITDNAGRVLLQNQANAARAGELPVLLLKDSGLRSSPFLGSDGVSAPWVLLEVLAPGETHAFTFTSKARQYHCEVRRHCPITFLWMIRECGSERAQEAEHDHRGQLIGLAKSASGVGFWSWDLVSGEVIWDERMHEMTQVAETLNMQQWLEVLTHPDDKERVKARAQGIASLGPLIPLASRIVRPDGIVRWLVTVSTVRNDEFGAPRYVQGGSLDITELQEFALAQQQEERQRTLYHLTSGIAHNFNNLLMIIEPCLEALEEVVPDSHLQFIHDAAEAGARSGAIIRDLMAVGNQQHATKTRATLFDQICKEAVERCRKTAPSGLSLDLRGSSECLVDCAPLALTQVVFNILKNAENALLESRTSNAKVLARVRDIRRDDQLWVELAITDNGPGMSDEIRHQIFNPFFTTRAGAGTGLGLTLCETIVRQHRGQLSCQSRPGQGTEFILHLPARLPSQSRPTDPKMNEPMKEGIRVLVVDDEPAICRIVTHTLTRHGFSSMSVSDPELIEQTLLQNNPFSIILLDRSMGNTHGAELVPMLREKAPGAKILYFTGEFVEPDEIDTVDGVVQKPVNGKQLTETLRKVL